MKKLLKILVILGTSWFFIHQIFIIVDGLRDESGKTEAAVILGNTVHEDGSLSIRLKARLDKGLELYSQGKVETIIVSGGLGKEGHYEGSKMGTYLVSQGVPKENVFIDNEGNTTQLTASNFVKNHPNIQSVTVVSQFYHISRCKLAFKKQNIKNVGGAHCDFYQVRDFYALFREFFAYYKYLLFA